jgi:2-phosphosulfolactate phosphatase
VTRTVRRSAGTVPAGAGLRRVEVYLAPAEADRATLDGRQIVIVDVLRSCTSIAVALEKGAAKIIPVATVEEATKLAQTLDPKSRVLSGERDGKKVGGFDLGNSPRDYTKQRVEGKTLIFASSNASPLMAGYLGGREQRLLSYVNLSAIVDAVQHAALDLAIVCAGKSGRFSLEDAACAGALVAKLSETVIGLERNDAAELVMEYDRVHGGDVEGILRRCEHGRYLIELGFEEDLPVCARIDSVPVVPYLKEGRITAQTFAAPSGAS